MKESSIVYTNDNCIGCNKCIKVCSAIGACISKVEKGKPRIEVDPSKCVACGSCIDVCEHNAREFRDDTEDFIRDLKNGENISLLLAPAFKANFPDEYEEVLGGLKQLGINRIISVSFGADITTWGYLNYIKEHDFVGGISQPCPVVVSYIEKYLPDLIPKIFPVQSPLMCAVIYARKKMGLTDKLAFISPCIGKKLEIEDPNNDGLVQYNVTFEHLMDYAREHGIKGPSVHSEIEYGLGSFYPTPGGLAENVKWFLGDQVYIRQIEGEKHLYEWMHYNEERIRENKTPFLFIDALNCEKGCICGTAVDPERAKSDDALYALLDIREKSKKQTSGDAWSRNDTPEERLANYNKQFSDLDLNDYLRNYTDRSAECQYEIPSDEDLDYIFASMYKYSDEEKNINCTCCGYESCRQMAIAIHNGFNRKENCIYYEKFMVRELAMEKMVAEEASIAKSSFLANMSHEIRTPINAVLGMNEMILRECSDKSIISYSESIKSAGSTLLGLVNNILDFSKIEAGNMEISPNEYDMSSVINDLVNMIQVRADDKGLSLNFDFDPALPKSLYGDEIRIKQIITNLLTNAVKYTEKGSITFSMKFEKPEKDNDHINLLVAVEDTGIGIKEEDISRVFNQFDRIEEKRNRNIEGTGLGMNITEKLLELMGSKLDVSSTYGKGSRFSFVLKQKVIGWEELGNYESAYQNFIGKKADYKGRFTAPSADILVIDDNAMNLMVFKSLLKMTKIRIDAGMSGDDGLMLSREKKYDIMFFDHMMPEKDGIETLAELKNEKDNPNIDTPVICLTANAISGAREQYLDAGFDDYLSKPVDPDKLEDMILHYMPEDKIIPVSDESKLIVKRILIICHDPSVSRKLRNALKDKFRVDVITAEDKFKLFLEKTAKDDVPGLILKGDDIKDLDTEGIPVIDISDSTTPEEILSHIDTGEDKASDEADGGAQEKKTSGKWYENIPGIDYETGITHSGNEDLYRQLMEVYFKSIKNNHEEINGLFENEDWKNYTIKVHALKSSSLLIGAVELSNEAKELEMAGKRDDIDYIKNNHATAMEHLLSYYEPLEAALNPDTNGSPGEVAETAAVNGDYEEINADGIFEAIREAAEKQDPAAIAGIIEEAVEQNISMTDAEMMDELYNLSESSDFEKILILIDGRQS